MPRRMKQSLAATPKVSAAEVLWCGLHASAHICTAALLVINLWVMMCLCEAVISDPDPA